MAEQLRPTGPADRRALLALAIDESQSLDNRYRLALQLEHLKDRGRSPESVAERAGVQPRAVELGRAALAQRDAIQRAVDQAEQLGIWLVTAVDAGYPQRLRELELPPPCLFCRATEDPNTGSRPLKAPAIGIVGPRNADPYGLEAARWFAADLSAAGLVITSGFARGVDGTSHEAAARAGNPTVAILGCGVDIAYPRQNQRLIEPILESGGLIVSEFPLGTHPERWRFPVRNRLIAAQTLGTVVVQASPRSGSLISARLALEHGRDVFAVPGRIFDQRSKGTNLLLRDGAHVAIEPQSVLDALPLSIQDELLRRRLGTDGALRHRTVLEYLASRPCTVDALAEQSGLSVDLLLQDLTDMELGGQVERQAGGVFTAATRPTG